MYVLIFLTCRLDENGICEGLTIGVRADFNITVSLLQCTEDNSDQMYLHEKLCMYT